MHQNYTRDPTTSPSTATSKIRRIMAQQQQQQQQQEQQSPPRMFSPRRRKDPPQYSPLLPYLRTKASDSHYQSPYDSPGTQNIALPNQVFSSHITVLGRMVVHQITPGNQQSPLHRLERWDGTIFDWERAGLEQDSLHRKKVTLLPTIRIASPDQLPLREEGLLYLAAMYQQTL